jgi:hypothetical protein
LSAPQFWQVRAPPPPAAGAAQARPLLQVPLQHAWSAPPHGAHICAAPAPPPWQDRPVSQVGTAPPPKPPPWQQAAPLVPHAVHIEAAAPPSAPPPAAPCVQRAPEAVQVVPPLAPQQIWPIAPHAVPAAFWHEPLVQVPVVLPLPQVVPAPTHIPATQQPPPLQVLEAQQA